MTTISETVLGTLRERGYGQYSSYATPVIDALVQREAGIVDNIMEFATAQGLSREQAREACRTAGLSVPDPEPTPIQSSQGPGQAEGGDLAATLARIEAGLNSMNAQVSSLTRFARDNGYTG